MSKARASIFEDAPDVDVASFAPKTTIDAKAPAAEQVRVVAEAAQFRSRQPAPPRPEPRAKRAPRQYRTGRNVQFNVKAQRETVDAFYMLSDAQGWVLGYTLQRALEALQRELGKPKS
jgi:hypothetical protein